MLSQQVLPRKAADHLIMGNCHRTALQFSKMQSHKSLILRCHLLLGHSNIVMATFFV